MSFLLLKYVHILGATVLLGTGIGIAFFMVMAHRSGISDLFLQPLGEITKVIPVIVLMLFCLAITDNR